MSLSVTRSGSASDISLAMLISPTARRHSYGVQLSLRQFVRFLNKIFWPRFGTAEDLAEMNSSLPLLNLVNQFPFSNKPSYGLGGAFLPRLLSQCIWGYALLIGEPADESHLL